MNKAAENVLVAMHTLGWQGGTIHQVVEATGLTIEQIHEADDIAALVKETRTLSKGYEMAPSTYYKYRFNRRYTGTKGWNKEFVVTFGNFSSRSNGLNH